jgi:hypothetical protein
VPLAIMSEIRNCVRLPAALLQRVWITSPSQTYPFLCIDLLLTQFLTFPCSLACAGGFEIDHESNSRLIVMGGAMALLQEMDLKTR